MAAPLVIMALDKTFDTSVFYNLNEEESSNGHDVAKHKIIPFFTSCNPIASILRLQKTKYHSYCLDNYNTQALETALQPPEYKMLYM